MSFIALELGTHDQEVRTAVPEEQPARPAPAAVQLAQLRPRNRYGELLVEEASGAAYRTFARGNYWAHYEIGCLAPGLENRLTRVMYHVQQDLPTISYTPVEVDPRSGEPRELPGTVEVPLVALAESVYRANMHARRDRRRMLQRLSEARQALDQAQQRERAVNTQRTELEQQLTAARGDNGVLIAELQVCEGEAAGLRTLLEKLNVEMERLGALATGLHAERDVLLGNIEQLRGRINAYVAEIGSANDEIDNVRNQIAERDVMIDSLRAEILGMQDNIEALSEQLENAGRELDQLRADVDVYAGERDTLAQQLDTALSTNAEQQHTHVEHVTKLCASYDAKLTAQREAHNAELEELRINGEGAVEALRQRMQCELDQAIEHSRQLQEQLDARAQLPQRMAEALEQLEAALGDAGKHGSLAAEAVSIARSAQLELEAGRREMDEQRRDMQAEVRRARAERDEQNNLHCDLQLKVGRYNSRGWLYRALHTLA